MVLFLQYSKTDCKDWVCLSVLLSFINNVCFLSCNILSSGSWLLVNGEGIYETKPWSVQNDTTTGNVWYTQSKNHNVIYAHLLEWPKDGQLYLGSVNSYLQDQSEISLLGFHPKLEVSIQHYYLTLICYLIFRTCILIFISNFSGKETKIT